MSSGLEDSQESLPVLTLVYHKETSPHYYLSYEKKWTTFENLLTFNIVKNFLNLHSRKIIFDRKSTDYLFWYGNQQYALPSNVGQTLENFLNREKHTVTIFPPYDTTQPNVVHPTLYSSEPRNMGDPFQHLNTWPRNFRL